MTTAKSALNILYVGLLESLHFMYLELLSWQVRPPSKSDIIYSQIL